MYKTKVYLADTAPLRDDALFRRLYRTVSPERQARIDQFRFRRDRMLSLGAGLLLQKALQDAGVEHIRLVYGPQGKPSLAGYKDLCFNLSHAGEKVMCAISRQAVGCDVEQIQDIELELAQRFFCATEYARIAAEPTAPRRRDTFFRLWTLKESFMKATGLGMALPLDSFSIDLTDENITVHQTADQAHWYFREYDFRDGYKYAVCGLSPHFDQAEFVTFS